jgi:tRNA(adenine34) deaminase
MALALQEARKAECAGEVPVGAIVVLDGQVIGSGHNQTIGLKDPCGHAEIYALQTAALTVGSHRLTGATLYVTLEPCAMCSGAIFQARLSRLVYGAHEPKTGTAGSVLDLFQVKELNHHTVVTSGVLSADCQDVLTQFFTRTRLTKRAEHTPLREDALRMDESSLPQAASRLLVKKYLRSVTGLQLRYFDSGPVSARNIVLFLHEYGFWSYQLWEIGAAFSLRGCRSVIPDLAGSGGSDRPKRRNWHNLDAHVGLLLELIEFEDLQITAIVSVGNVHSLAVRLKHELNLPEHRLIHFGLEAEVPSDSAALQHKHRGNIPADAWPQKAKVGWNALPADARLALIAHFPDRGHMAIFESLGTSPYWPVILSQEHINSAITQYLNEAAH